MILAQTFPSCFDMGGLLVLFETQKIGYRLISLCSLLTFFN